MGSFISDSGYKTIDPGYELISNVHLKHYINLLNMLI